VSASPETADRMTTAEAIAATAADGRLARGRWRTRPNGFVRRGWLVRRLLLVADLAGLSLAFVLAQLLVQLRGGVGGAVALQAELLLFVVALPCWVVAAKLAGLYDRDCERTDHSTFDDAATVFHLVTSVAWLLVIVGWATEIAHPDFLKLLLFWALAIALVVAGRASARAFARRTAAYRQNTLIVGAGRLGALLSRKIRNHPEYGLDVVGFVDARSNGDEVGTLPLLGAPHELPALIATHDVERVIVAFPEASSEETLAVVRALKGHDVQIDLVPRLHEVVFPGATIHTLEGLPLLGLPRFGLSRSSALLKRTMDFAAAAVALVVLAPLFALVALLIKLDSPGPVFFRQLRMGRGGTTFLIFKFRSMAADADARKRETMHLNMHSSGDARMFKIPEDPRTTRVGRLLRRYSLDELPQLINVLRGEMSLVGPRPLILEEDEHVSDWARRRLDLRPGITGLWQVLGRSDIPFDEMTQLDYRYVMTWSLWTDFRLLFQTLPAVLRRRGAY
jgi:exopolysaccharide biosynthesis polyprenyl glycosylphosphotransferase